MTQYILVTQHFCLMSLTQSDLVLLCLVFCSSLWQSLSDLLQLSLPVCFTMPLVLDAVWALWSIGAGIYDYFHTSAMEERIHTLENVLSIHQFVIAGLSAGLILLMTYILWRKHWNPPDQGQTPTRSCFVAGYHALPRVVFILSDRLDYVTDCTWRRSMFNAQDVPNEVRRTDGETKLSTKAP